MRMGWLPGRSSPLFPGMARLKTRVKDVLMESRVFVLSGSVLFGFQFKAHFKEEWVRLPDPSRWALLFALTAMTLVMVLMIFPTQFHRLTERGEDSARLYRLTSRVLLVAGLPFSAALAADLFVAAGQVLGPTAAWSCGLGTFGVAMLMFFGIEAWRAPRRRGRIGELKRMEPEEDRQAEAKGTDLETKISHVLTEARVVLPGASALLGFQFVVFLSTPFVELPQQAKLLHLVATGLIALAVLMLVSPAAYHRLVERGEVTEHFHRFASRMIVLSLVPMGLGMAGDFYLVTDKVLGGRAAGWSTGVLLVLLSGLWFVLPLAVRRRRR